MRRYRITKVVLLALSLTSVAGAQAQDLQPGMQTMMQQGGIEGVELGSTVFDTTQDDKLQPGMKTMMQQGGVEGVTLGSAIGGAYGYDFSSPRSVDRKRYRTRRHNVVGTCTAEKKNGPIASISSRRRLQDSRAIGALACVAPPNNVDFRPMI